MIKMMLLSGAFGTAALGLGVATASAQTSMSKMAVSTPEFVKKASQSDEFEIREGKLAAEAGTPAVRKFGELMVRDHTKTTEGLHAALKAAGMPVPPPPALSAEQDAMMAKLKGLHGAAFDRVYVAEAVMSHKQALALHEAYDRDGDVKPIVAASREATPIVKEHLQMAERLAEGKPGAM